MKIKRDVYKAMIQHAIDLKPIESCGYLAGTATEINTFYPMTNTDQSAEHFTFDPKEQFQVVKEARANGLKLLSVYHSHPESPARLSEEDIKLLNDPEMIYIIVSLREAKPAVKAYQIRKPDEDTIEIDRVELTII